MDSVTVLRLAHDQAVQYPSVVIEHPFGPEYAVFKVRGRMFMMQYELRGVPSMNLKIDPLDGEVLRDAYAEITPGYHMNKRHWITVCGADGTDTGAGGGTTGDGGGDDGGAGTDPGTTSARAALDEDLLHDLVLESYCLVVAKMPRRDRPVDPATFGGREA
ncbi:MULTISPECIES: MmcQ/YjbR family DNA-binding protein [unclassified Brevibacterium]|uniref:MmcQ/YjbR family DNA-binding protein n=1 Tax=unclassified Brevibacterium TaxID=2614124 RepID=UPI0010F76D95|nr:MULTISPECIES: MmcQ/YjbR family DNA-binding protein [unclassified Brevibacterium]MCM1011212.1 MmcQ/YjbR family DNA-binding protein [Brevibacterium sp. XM4083]